MNQSTAEQALKIDGRRASRRPDSAGERRTANGESEDEHDDEHDF